VILVVELFADVRTFEFVDKVFRVQTRDWLLLTNFPPSCFSLNGISLPLLPSISISLSMGVVDLVSALNELILTTRDSGS